jgi:hypothetical protein
MNYYIIPAALLVTFLILLIFSAFSKRPMAGLWIFFLIIFLATWTGQLWITPFGPVVWGIAWIPLFIVALFFSFLIFALLPPVAVVTKAEENKEEERAAIVFGTFFWIMLILLIIAIIVGHYRIAYLIKP